MKALDEAVAFFREHGGYAWLKNAESEEQARDRCARRLADAEARVMAGPYFFTVEPDDMPWDGDVPWDGPVWMVSLWSVQGSTESVFVGSLSGVACEADSAYLRVVKAEIAAENLVSTDGPCPCGRSHTRAEHGYAGQ